MAGQLRRPIASRGAWQLRPWTARWRTIVAPERNGFQRIDHHLVDVEPAGLLNPSFPRILRGRRNSRSTCTSTGNGIWSNAASTSSSTSAHRHPLPKDGEVLQAGGLDETTPVPSS